MSDKRAIAIRELRHKLLTVISGLRFCERTRDVPFYQRRLAMIRRLRSRAR